ncbi:SDR family NAD(P)-dependent oxidoreductase, partial [Pseudomonas syringae group genomosp. 7]
MPEPIQSVLVTGASSGIGKAIVTRLLEQGLQVTGLSRRAPDL